MGTKLGLVAGLGVGYLLGTRAGREKFDQMISRARKAWDHPTVQEAAGVVQERAQRFYDNSRHAVTDRVRKTDRHTGESSFEPEDVESGREVWDEPARTGQAPSGQLPDAAF